MLNLLADQSFRSGGAGPTFIALRSETRREKKAVSLDAEFNVIKIDPASGKMLGRFEARAHELTIAPDSCLLPATRSSQLLLFRLRI